MLDFVVHQWWIVAVVVASLVPLALLVFAALALVALLGWLIVPERVS